MRRRALGDPGTAKKLLPNIAWAAQPPSLRIALRSRRSGGDVSPAASVNLSLPSRNSCSVMAERTVGTMDSIRRRTFAFRSKVGEGRGPPTTPTMTGEPNRRWVTFPYGGTPATSRMSSPPPRIAATPPRPPPPNSSARWATSTARCRGIRNVPATANAVASAPAALIPNPCPTGIWCASRMWTGPVRGGTSLRATSVEIGSGPSRSALTVVRVERPGRHSSSATTPSSRTSPAPVEPRALGSRSRRSGEKNPVTWPGAKARARTSRALSRERATTSAKLDYL
jgi:hypothetical protein